MTLWCHRPHVIPNQLQKCIESFHELNIIYGSWDIDSLNFSKAKRLVLFVVALAVMVGCNKHRFITKIRYIGQNAYKCFWWSFIWFEEQEATLRYATEQPSSLDCNYVREMSEGLKIEFILCKGDLTMRAKVKKIKSFIDHKRMTSQISVSNTTLSCRLLLLSPCFFHPFMLKNINFCANGIPSMSSSPQRSSSQSNIVWLKSFHSIV